MTLKDQTEFLLKRLKVEKFLGVWVEGNGTRFESPRVQILHNVLAREDFVINFFLPSSFIRPRFHNAHRVQHLHRRQQQQRQQAERAGDQHTGRREGVKTTLKAKI